MLKYARLSKEAAILLLKHQYNMLSEILPKFDTIAPGKEMAIIYTSGLKDKKLILGKEGSGFVPLEIGLQVSPDNETWCDLISLEKYPNESWFILKLSELTSPDAEEIKKHQVLTSKHYRSATGGTIYSRNTIIAKDTFGAVNLRGFFDQKGISAIASRGNGLPDQIAPDKLEKMASYFLDILLDALEENDFERIDALNLETLLAQTND